MYSFPSNPSTFSLSHTLQLTSSVYKPLTTTVQLSVLCGSFALLTDFVIFLVNNPIEDIWVLQYKHRSYLHLQEVLGEVFLSLSPVFYSCPYVYICSILEG